MTPLTGPDSGTATTRPVSKGRELFYFLLLTLFAFVLYAQIFLYDSIGPEFPLFFFYNHNLPFGQMLRAYIGFDQMWYRPTSFALFYWIGDQLFSWHNLHAWRAFHLFTVIAVAYAIYRLTLELFPGRRVAGMLAGIFFLAHPSLFPFVYQVAPFDFPYIGLSAMCVVFYVRGFRSEGSASLRQTFAAWLFFVIALTAKEATLAIPGYLGVASLILLWGETEQSHRMAGLRRELFRLAPFLVLLPVYWLLHMKQVSQSTFSTEGSPYRSIVDLQAILENLRTLPLWTVRLYFFTGKTLRDTMYHSTLVNNAAGLAILAGVVFQWRQRLRAQAQLRHIGLLLVAWMVTFLLLPIYAGGYLWHVNLSVVGYAILAGVAASWYLEGLADQTRSRAGLAVLVVALLALGWSNLRVELYGGTHSIGFKLAKDLLTSPPVPPEKLPPSPIIAFEDRLGLGPWWYGCYGRLFNYIYLRQDIEEILIPPNGPIPRKLLPGSADPARVFLFRYDQDFRWHDASEELRNPLGLSPQIAAIGPGETQQFYTRTTEAGTAPVVWSISPKAFGEMQAGGLYVAPAAIPAPRTVIVTATRTENPAYFSRSPITVTRAWQSSDIGKPQTAGSHREEESAQVLTGAGDIFGKTDSFHFVHQPFEGDGVMVARISKAPGGRAKAGLMFRSSLSADSAHVFSAVFGTGVSLLETRPATGAETTATFGQTGAFWLALGRKGDTFTAFSSQDGSIWSRIGTPLQVALGTKVLAGLAVSSGNEPGITIPFERLRFQRTFGISGPGELPFAPIRINAGGLPYLDSEGRIWRADEGSSAGSTASVAATVANTKDASLYSSERWSSGPFHYQFAVPEGRYRIRLKFAEVYYSKPGQRRFDVKINGVTVLPDFDILQQAGGANRAIDREFPVDVRDELVTIEFLPVVSNPKVNAIEIVPE